MTQTETNPLNDSAFMAAFLDIVIPPSKDGSRPGAGSLGLGRDLAESLNADDQLGPLVSGGLQALRAAAKDQDPGGFTALPVESRQRTVSAVVADQPFLMLGVVRYLYLSYYQHPQVLAGLGDPPRPPFPEGYVVEDTDLKLMDSLEKRKQTP